MTPEQERDAVDRLFVRLESVEPPADLTARIMLRVRESEAARWAVWQQVAFGAGYILALLVLAVLSYMTGIELERSHLRDLLSLAIQDVSSVTQSPGVYLAAVREAIPWPHVLAVLGDIALLAVATRLVLKVASPRRQLSDERGSLAGATPRRIEDRDSVCRACGHGSDGMVER